METLKEFIRSPLICAYHWCKETGLPIQFADESYFQNYDKRDPYLSCICRRKEIEQNECQYVLEELMIDDHDLRKKLIQCDNEVQHLYNVRNMFSILKDKSCEIKKIYIGKDVHWQIINIDRDFYRPEDFFPNMEILFYGMPFSVILTAKPDFVCIKSKDQFLLFHIISARSYP